MTDDMSVELNDTDLIPEGAQPLEARGIRWDKLSLCWRRSIGGREGMSYKIKRKSVSQLLAIPEATLANWEASYARQWAAIQVSSATAALAVGEDGSCINDPLVGWGIRYYPQSQTWRRARAARDELSREKVAKAVGVSVDAILAWERARLTSSDGPKS